MSTELARVPDTSSDVLAMVGELANKIAGTSFVPTSMRGKVGEVAACILTGREIGIGPMEALQKIHVIDGRPTLSAELMRAQVLRAGHHIRVTEASETAVTAEGRRKDEDTWTAVTFTIEQARRAGLDQRPNWKKHPRQMLSARATSELCRLMFPDALGGISYTPDEVADIEPEQPQRRVTVAELSGQDVEAAPIDEAVAS